MTLGSRQILTLNKIDSLVRLASFYRLRHCSESLWMIIDINKAPNTTWTTTKYVQRLRQSFNLDEYWRYTKLTHCVSKHHIIISDIAVSCFGWKWILKKQYATSLSVLRMQFYANDRNSRTITPLAMWPLVGMCLQLLLIEDSMHYTLQEPHCSVLIVVLVLLFANYGNPLTITPLAMQSLVGMCLQLLLMEDSKHYTLQEPHCRV